MDYEYKLNFEDVGGNSNDRADEATYKPAARNICFAWADGRMRFLNYAYMIGADYIPEDGTIKLSFTTDTLVLKGIKLDLLFEKFFFHMPIRVRCMDERYEDLSGDSYIVTEILENEVS